MTEHPSGNCDGKEWPPAHGVLASRARADLTLTDRAGRRLTHRKTQTAVAGARGLRVAAAMLGIFLCSHLLMPGLAHATERRGPVKSLLEMRTDHVIVQKYDLSCGAAAIATILDFQYGLHVTEKEVAQGLISRKIYIEHPELVRIREGFSLLDMKRYVDSLGFQGIGYGSLELKDIVRLAPIIVPVRLVGYNHFVIFRGISGGSVLLADPAFGNRIMPIKKFDRVWIKFPKIGRVGFIVTRNGKPGPPGLLGLRRDQFVAPSDDFVRQTLPF